MKKNRFKTLKKNEGRVVRRSYNTKRGGKKRGKEFYYFSGGRKCLLEDLTGKTPN